MLKNVIGEQTIHHIFDIPERCLDIWEERGDVIDGQARGNSTGDFSINIVVAITRPGMTYLADTRAAATSSSGVRGTTGGLRLCKRLGEGRTGVIMSIGPEVLADGTDWALDVGTGVAESGDGSWDCVRSGVEAEGD